MCFGRALKYDPELPRAELNKGVVLYKMHRWDEALVSFEKVLSRDPKNKAAIAFKCDILKKECLAAWKETKQ